MSLFRAESQEARAGAWLGRIVLARPPSFALLTGAALTFAAALAAFFVFGEYTRKARVTGALAPTEGVVKVVAPQAGRIESLGAREGETVQRSATLFTVVDARAGAASEPIAQAVEGRLRERDRTLAEQRGLLAASLGAELAALAQRSRGLGREMAQLDDEIDGQARRLALAERALDRAERLRSTGFLSALALDRERDAVLEQRARLESMRRTQIALGREAAAHEHDHAAARARGGAQLAAIDAQRAAIEQERLERTLQYRARIAAPVSGLVAAVLVEPGQVVAPGATMASIIPSDARLEAHLYAPSHAIGFVRPGQEVLLRYVAYPHQKFGAHRARVAAISRNALPPAELGVPEAGREPLYRIKVALPAQAIDAYGRPEPLAAGMQVEADILLDRRRLIEWVFEPLLSLAGRA